MLSNFILKYEENYWDQWFWPIEFGYVVPSDGLLAAGSVIWVRCQLDTEVTEGLPSAIVCGGDVLQEGEAVSTPQSRRRFEDGWPTIHARYFLPLTFQLQQAVDGLAAELRADVDAAIRRGEERAASGDTTGVFGG